MQVRQPCLHSSYVLKMIHYLRILPQATSACTTDLPKRSFGAGILVLGKKYYCSYVFDKENYYIGIFICICICICIHIYVYVTFICIHIYYR